MKIYRIAEEKLYVWLDDNRDPKDPDTQELFGTTGNETWIKTIEEVQPLILQGRVGFVDFDSDLGEGVTDGYKLSDWIEEKAYHNEIDRIGWRVHSQNTQNAPKILAGMTNADRFWDQHGK